MKINKNPLRIIGINCLLLLGLNAISKASMAAVIEYDLTSLGGNGYQYSYKVTNSGALSAIEEFTIYFDLGLFTNIQTIAAPAGWDPLAIQTDAALSADGFFDGLTLGAPLFAGESVGGFVVQFEWLGLPSTLPGSQRFEVVDPLTFVPLFSGNTVVAQVSGTVSAPSPFTLLVMGLVMFGCCHFYRKAQVSASIHP